MEQHNCHNQAIQADIAKTDEQNVGMAQKLDVLQERDQKHAEII